MDIINTNRQHCVLKTHSFRATRKVILRMITGYKIAIDQLWMMVNPWIAGRR